MFDFNKLNNFLPQRLYYHFPYVGIMINIPLLLRYMTTTFLFLSQ